MAFRPERQAASICADLPEVPGVLILIDGHPQYATIYGHPVADAYIASDAERVEVSQRHSLTDSYRNGKFSGVFSGNYERTDGHRVNSEYESFSGYGKLGYDISKEWKITGNVNIAQSNAQGV